MEKIQFNDLNRLNEEIRTSFFRELVSIYNEGIWINGSRNERLSSLFVKEFGLANFMGCGNGYDALYIIFKGYIELGMLRKGDKVLIPNNTFIATALAVLNNGLEVYTIDPDLRTYNLSEDKVLALCEKHPEIKAVIYVNLYGRFDLSSSLVEKLNMRGVLLVEDNAQSIGAIFEDKHSGSVGNASAFSFYPGKNLGALGDGGGLSCDNEELFDVCKKIANYGSTIKYSHEIVGVNSRLDEIQALVLMLKFPYLNNDSLLRSEVARMYTEQIVSSDIVLPVEPSFWQNDQLVRSHVWHLFVVRFESYKAKLALVNELNVHNIVALEHYPKGISEHEAFLSRKDVTKLDRSTLDHKNLLSLPIHPHMSKSEVSQVIKVINETKFR